MPRRNETSAPPDGPGPVARQVKAAAASRVGESTGRSNELATDRLGDECSLELKPESANPARQVVRD
jgi:hypothetical protein